VIHTRGRLKWCRHSEDEKETKQPSSLCAISVLGSVCSCVCFCLLACLLWILPPPASARSFLLKSHGGGAAFQRINRLSVQSISRSPGCLSMHRSQVKPGWSGSIQGLLWLLSQCVDRSIDASEVRPEWAIIGHTFRPAKRKERGGCMGLENVPGAQNRGFPSHNAPLVSIFVAGWRGARNRGSKRPLLQERSNARRTE